jgi:hypothetical protein
MPGMMVALATIGHYYWESSWAAGCRTEANFSIKAAERTSLERSKFRQIVNNDNDNTMTYAHDSPCY